MWSADMPDWNAAIEAISADPKATRFERPHDILPLRKEQIVDYGDDDLFEMIIDMLEHGVLASEWIPLADIIVDPENWSYEATEFFEGVQQWCGKKTQDVMPTVIEWFNKNNDFDIWRKDFSEKTRFKIGGAEVLVGRPYIDLRLLDSLSCSAIVIAPHLSRRGPNGLWVLIRGAKHPLAEQFATCQAHYLSWGGSPDVAECFEGWRSCYSLELFRQQEQVEIRQQEIKKENDELDFDISSTAGNDLLSLISVVDLVELDSVRYAITRDGQIFDEADDIVTVEELVSALTN